MRARQPFRLELRFSGGLALGRFFATLLLFLQVVLLVAVGVAQIAGLNLRHVILLDVVQFLIVAAIAVNFLVVVHVRLNAMYRTERARVDYRNRRNPAVGMPQAHRGRQCVARPWRYWEAAP
jgi:hypothetical protein